MSQRLHRGHSGWEFYWRRLDHAAGLLNPYLTLLTFGLAILCLTSLLLLGFKLPITRVGANGCVAPAATAANNDWTAVDRTVSGY